jgi:Leucine-rich repeat (LRR) protein
MPLLRISYINYLFLMKLAQFALPGSKIRCLMTGTMMMFLLLSFFSSGASVALQQSDTKSFEAWCNQRKSVPADTRKTINMLLKEAGTKDCKLADRKLKTLTNLKLSGNKISDVKPLAGLTKLVTLSLGGNPIGIKVCPIRPESSCSF